MLKSYQAGIAGMRWLVSPRSDVDPVLQYALRPIHGGALDWIDVPTEVAPDRERAASLVASEDTKRLDWMEAQGYSYGFEDMHEGNRWEIAGPFKSIREAVDAGIKHDAAKASAGEAQS